MNKNKRGISLIVLVITIAVMIILAAAIILSLNGSNIIGKANEAKSKSDVANAKQLVTLAKAEWDLKSEEIIKENPEMIFEEYAEQKLKDAGYNTDGNGGLQVSKEGGINTIYIDEKDEEVLIPDGFTVSTIPGETTIDGGLVIYEGTEPVTNVDSDSNGIIDAQETRNQFVWVPVDDYSKFQRTTTYKEEEGITNPESSYTEPFSKTTNDSITLSLTNDLTGEWEESAAMRTSVQANGGFYIGRYEVGTTIERKYAANNGTTDLLVQKNKIIYNNVCWGQSMTEIEGEVTDYEGYKQGLGAVELSRNMYRSSKSVVSTLCYGVQWDAALRFISTNDEHIDFAKDSKNKGNYTGHIEETGYYATNNIYDMAGNVWEWTMEASFNNVRISRGGIFNKDVSSYPAFIRGNTAPNYTGSGNGFRITLYIK